MVIDKYKKVNIGFMIMNTVLLIVLPINVFYLLFAISSNVCVWSYAYTGACPLALLSKSNYSWSFFDYAKRIYKEKYLAAMCIYWSYPATLTMLIVYLIKVYLVKW